MKHITITTDGLLTGQEWYDKFIEELGALPPVAPAHTTFEAATIIATHTLEAAKRAAGIQ